MLLPCVALTSANASVQPPCAAGWTVTNLTQNTGTAVATLAFEYSTLATERQYVWVTYTTQGAVAVRRSADGGQTFAPAVGVGPGSGGSYAKIAVSGSYVYLTWTQGIGAGQRSIFFAVSADFGSTWSTPQQVSPKGGSGYEVIDAHERSRNVYLAYAHGHDVFISVSHDRGTTFAPAVNLTQNPKGSKGQEIAMKDDGGRAVHVVYEEVTGIGGADDDGPDAPPGSALMRTSLDDGATWGPAVNISQDTANRAFEPLITTQSVTPTRDIYAIWRQTGSNNLSAVYTSRSEDRGATWSPPLVISPMGKNARAAAIASDGRVLYATWREDIGTSWQTIIRRSNDGGRTWGRYIRSGPTGVESIGTGENNNSAVFSETGTQDAYVGWNQTAGSSGLMSAFVSGSADGGRTWSTPVDLGGGAGSSNHVLGTTGTSASGTVVPMIDWQGKTGSAQDVFFATCAPGSPARTGRPPEKPRVRASPAAAAVTQ